MTLTPVPTMNPEPKRLWVAGLNSEDYPQGKGALQREGNLCCLGVLCEVAIKAGVLITKTVDMNGVVAYDGETEHLPDAVVEWAGIGTNNPTVIVDEDDEDSGTDEVVQYEREFVMLNDDMEWDFHRIADIIEAQL